MSVRVPLRERRDVSYDIEIGHGLLGTVPARLRAAVPADRYAIITDSNVAALYGEGLAAACRDAGLRVELLTFPAGESYKTRDTWAALSDRLLAARVGRDGVVVALGGGVVGDVAGFVAATHLRGIPCVQVPTTLLAMIDASIGGKTGVDTAAGKNLVGAFHQPRLVVADLDVLGTLPLAHLAAGMAEAIKHGVIADAEYFALVERERAAVMARDPGVLERVVTRSVEIKAGVVAADEREAGRRVVLNFGHTVGHAVEATSRYGVLHGEAVGIGMAVEGRLGEQLQVTESGVASRIERVLESYGLPRQPPAESTVDEFIALMRHDKKTRAGMVQLALPRAIGRMAGSAAQGWTIAVAEEVLRGVLGAHPGSSR